MIDDVSLSKDKSIMKKQVVQGKGDQKPRDSDLVRIAVEGAFFTNGQKAPGFVGRTELSFKVGDGEVCDALEHAVPEMLLGERAIIICSRASLCAEAKLGLAGIASLKGEANLMVALLKYDRNEDVSEMQDDERVKFAAGRKEVGGKLFKAQRYGLALERYKAVVEVIGSCESPAQDGVELIRICQLNQAACMLKLNDPSGAKAVCKLVLKDDPSNIKALFRRASAYLALCEYAEAASDLRHLLELDPENKEAQRLLPQAVRNAKEDKQKSALMGTKMTKALDGDFSEEQAKRMKEERETKKPGQVMSIAEQEREWDRAMDLAKADLEKIQEMQGKTKDEPVCESGVPTLDSSEALAGFHYAPSK